MCDPDIASQSQKMHLQGLEDRQAGGHHANDIQGALSELTPALHLLGSFAVANSSIILEIAHTTVVRDNTMDVSLAHMLARAISIFMQLQAPTASLIGVHVHFRCSQQCGILLLSAGGRCCRTAGLTWQQAAAPAVMVLILTRQRKSCRLKVESL